jgi:2-polyprenyl-3-methyl-5-hydroxy-6-metoxy-1,4-benzoquinol methylase
MTKESTYQDKWDYFYENLQKNGEDSLWEVDLAESIQKDYEILENHFDFQLPIIDFGCGSGLISNFLSQHFSHVTALDASAVIINENKSKKEYKHIRFDVYDGIDAIFAQKKHEELGDANIYIRGVLHQVARTDIPIIINNLKTLLGGKGTLFIVESSPDIRTYLDQNSSFSSLPLSMKKVFLSDLSPEGVTHHNIDENFPKANFEILQHGSSEIVTRLNFKSGKRIKIPSVFYVIRSLINNSFHKA